MHWFILEAPNRPGELAAVAEDIAGRGVNLAGLVSLGVSDGGGIAVAASDEGGLRTALDEGGITYRELATVSVSLADVPGSAAAAARSLAQAGVNIEMFALLGDAGSQATVAVDPGQVDAARAALGDG